MKIKALFTPLLLGFLLLISSAGIDARQLFSNNGSSTLSAVLTDVGTSMSVVTGEGALFNAPTGGDYELITLTDGTNVEIVKATARATDTLTIARAQEGTTAIEWAAGTTAQGRITKGTLERLTQNNGLTATSIAIGAASKSEGAGSAVVGDNAAAFQTDNSIIGPRAYSDAVDAVLIGSDTYIDTSSAGAIAIGDQASIGIGAISSIAIGQRASIGNSDSYANAIGADAFNERTGTTVIAGPILSRKDRAEDAADAFRFYSGVEVVLLSKVIDLKTLLDDAAVLTMPTGVSFYPDEVGLIIAAASTITLQPDISFGITGNTTALLGSTTTTAAAAKAREVHTPTSLAGVGSLTASVKTAATATTLTGRFYWKGLLVENP